MVRKMNWERSRRPPQLRFSIVFHYSNKKKLNDMWLQFWNTASETYYVEHSATCNWPSCKCKSGWVGKKNTENNSIRVLTWFSCFNELISRLSFTLLVLWIVPFLSRNQPQQCGTKLIEMQGKTQTIHPFIAESVAEVISSAEKNLSPTNYLIYLHCDI